MRGVLLGVAALAAPVGAAAPALTFAQVFDAPGEPAAIRYQVDYRTGAVLHRLTVWRDGERRIKRQTDGALTSLAIRDGRGPAYRLTLLDNRRKLATTISRSGLFQVGNFTEWYDLGHGLRYPKAAYRLVTGAAPAGAPQPLHPCRWYDLAQGGHVTHVCWAAADHLPLLMIDEHGAVRWQVTAVSRAPIAPGEFTVDTRGYVRNDADADMQHD